MKIVKSFESFNSTKVDRNYVSRFLIDFGFLISLNFSQITTMGVDVNATNELKTMMSNLRKPIINGLNYFDLTKNIDDVYKNPKLLSEVLNKIREFLIYIEPRIERFVRDCEYKTKWLEKIADLKSRYKHIVSNV